MDKKSLENSFKLYLSTTRGLTARTVKNYLSDFRHFWSWLILATRTIKPQKKIIAKITPLLLFRYKSYLLTNNIAKSTVKRRLATVRIFCQFCLDQRWLKQNPALRLENPPSANAREKEIHRLLSQFGAYLKKQRASKNTIKNYVADVRQYLLTINE